MRKSTVSLLSATAVLLASCAARGDDGLAPVTTVAAVAPVSEVAAVESSDSATPSVVDTAPPTDAAPPVTDPPKVMFGTLESPCGPGTATIADGQNGGDTLKLGTKSDHGSDISPGLTIEMLDAAEAFAGWCNEQGGIQGLPIEIVDLDGKLFSVPQGIEQACAEVFAMVGGGWVFDDQEFPRFHECKMIDFPGYSVTPTKAESNGKVQPIPNPALRKPGQWLIWGAQAYPEEVKKTAILYGDFESTRVVAQSIKESMELTGWTVVDEIPYAPTGEANWAPFVQRMKDGGITAMTFVGQETNLVALYKAMAEVGYRPTLTLMEANMYSSTIIAPGSAELAEGTFYRTAYAPFEEANNFPGMMSYLDMMSTYNPDGKIAGLGLQATSAMLLFATAANDCLASNGGVLERECVLAAGLNIHSWTGGGLHAETDPGAGLPPKCGLILTVKDGAFTRVYPEFGSADDNGGGWRCEDAGVIELSGDYGDLTAGVDPSRPN